MFFSIFLKSTKLDVSFDRIPNVWPHPAAWHLLPIGDFGAYAAAGVPQNAGEQLGSTFEVESEI